jgi:pimeloyl-ACP methyl ester carboxylesterase
MRMETISIPTARGSVPALAIGEPDAPPLVCLHGFPDHPLTFAEPAELLIERGWRVVAPFLRGYHPDHGPLDGHVDIATLVADALALLDALSPTEPVHVIGHDWGAMVVHGIAASRADRLARSVALAVPPLEIMGLMLGVPAQIERSFYIWFFQLADIPELVLSTDRGFIDHLWATWSPNLRRIPHRAAVHEIFADPQRTAAALGYYRALIDPATGDPALAELRGQVFGPPGVPLLVLGGAEDGCMDEGIFRAACQNLPEHSRADIIDGVGHFMHLEDPAGTVERIDDWLRTV